ncbi:hypothetical protein DET57_103210 [Klebsiella oxytoca]|uniref:Uncharacterized protein n=1 Tax=Klebsiella oxytoca TaxID=571 RepID=A0A318FWI0_KLEOX|nr:hypothetical protein DET57_103210 [Klebsiella oxytoca]
MWFFMFFILLWASLILKEVNKASDNEKRIKSCIYGVTWFNKLLGWLLFIKFMWLNLFKICSDIPGFIEIQVIFKNRYFIFILFFVNIYL